MPGTFLKGLCVVDDVAYFGLSPRAPRSARADRRLSCEVAALNLTDRRLLWRHKVRCWQRARKVQRCSGR